MLRLRSTRVLVASGAVILSAVAGFNATAQASIAPGDWSSAGASSNRTGYNASSLVTPTNLARFTRKWSATGGSFSAPVVAGFGLAVADNGVNGRSRLEGYDTRTGARRWAVDYGSSADATVGSPATDGTRVFVMIERPSGMVWRYDLGVYDMVTGKKVWSAFLGTAPSRLRPRPVLTAYGNVYVQTVATNSFSGTSAYSAGGTLRFVVPETAPVNSIAVGGGVLYHATASNIFAYDFDSGVYLNSVGTGATSIAVGGNALYGVDATRFFALDKQFFGPLWAVPLQSGCSAFVRVIAPGFGMASQPCANGKALVVDTLTGRTLNPSTLAVGDTPIAATKQLVVLVTPSGGLKAWNLTSGAAITVPQPTAAARLSGQSGPILANGLLVVPEVGRLEAFGL